MDQHFLARGSKNVIIANVEKFGSRQGYTLQSEAGTEGQIEASTEWENSTGDEFSLKAHLVDPSSSTSGKLEVLIEGVWQTLMESLSSVALMFDPYWDNTEKIDRLLWCNGSANLYDWSGATAKLSTITTTTVTCQGTKTFGQQRFLTTSTRAIRIQDDNGTWHRTVYTGGESTTTLTGLSDLTAYPFSGGNLIVQEVITRANIPDSSFKTDFLRVIDNQVWAGSRVSNKVYVSKNTSVTDYAYSTPRAVGEGALLTLDGPGRSIGVLRGDVILGAGRNYVYKSQFNQITVGSSLAETLKVVRLKTTSNQAPLHQNLVAEMNNGLMWIGHDNVLYELFDASLAYNPDLRPVSDPVKPDFDAADFTGGHMKFHNTRLYISAPLSALNFIYEYRLNNKMEREWFWQPPQTFPVKRWAVIDGLIYGHSSQNNETYKLFDGYNDNGKAIHSIATLARWNGGVRDALKKVDELFNEGAISANTELPVTYDFDKDGGEKEPVTKIISGLYADVLFTSLENDSLGENPEGDVSLAGDVTDEDPISHFRIIDDINEQEFFDYGVTFETNDIDYRWEIMCHGNNATLSTGKPTGIKNNN